MDWRTLDDFRRMPPGTVVQLGYHAINAGAFWWKHSRVAGDRVMGPSATMVLRTLT